MMNSERDVGVKGLVRSWLVIKSEKFFVSIINRVALVLLVLEKSERTHIDSQHSVSRKRLHKEIEIVHD